MALVELTSPPSPTYARALDSGPVSNTRWLTRSMTKNRYVPVPWPINTYRPSALKSKSCWAAATGKPHAAASTVPATFVCRSVTVSVEAASSAARGESTDGYLDFTTPEHGAATQVWAAVSPELADQGGLYLEDCRVGETGAPYARDTERAAELWTLSEKLCAAS